MNLSNEEKRFYEDNFAKLTQNNQALKEAACRPLLNRGIGNSTISDKIWALVSDNNTKQVLKKKDLFKLLKYISAYQNGYQLDDIVLNDLPELAVPCLSKKKRKNNRNADIAKESIQPETKHEEVSCPQVVEQSPEKALSGENSPVRGSVMSCPSTEEPSSERHISPDKEQVKDQLAEEKLTDVLEKDNLLQQDPSQEAGFDGAALEKFESPEVIPESVENLPDQMEAGDAAEVVVEETIPQEEEPKNLEEEPKNLEEDSVVVDAPQEEEPAIEIHHEEELGLTNQLDLIKNSQNNTQPEIISSDEKLQHYYDDDERRSKDSISSGRNSFKSNRSQLSYDSSSKGIMNLANYNLYLEQNQKIKVDIRDTITYNSGFLGYGTYTTYLIRSKYPDSDVLEAERRFRDFDWLNSYFQSHPPYKGLVVPALPEKKSIGNNEPGFIQQRKAELDRYLKEISRHKVLSQDPVLRTFLGEKGREGLQTLKEKIQVNGLSLPELDWQRIKEVCEYAMASVKVKLQKESVPNDWKDSNEKIYDVLRIDGMIRKLLKTLQKREELYKTVKIMNNNLNVLHMKIMNRVEKESYYAIGSLSSLMVAQGRNMNDEAFITDNFIKQIKVFRSKIDGCKKSYALMISTLQEIGTNKELYKNKQGKMFEYKAEKNLHGIGIATKELGEIEKKVETLEKETAIIKENLNLEAEALVELFDIFLPDALSFFNIQQAEQFEKMSRTWEGISQE